MLKKILVAALPIFVLLAIPFFLRPASGAPSDAPAEKLVIISAHNESIKYE